ncbi:hypothetical protein CPB84DRAFT_1819748 [Gymnopilus junonius]|uniref:Uncharacterized protein n=1 Tax=Gymnopilus junonius TaxID=109634 RepID=A0A9P5N7F2_GYMJU|nr:hypothetical protein CPB84DRAFT_1819748 [Gymnopilus junonius]
MMGPCVMMSALVLFFGPQVDLSYPPDYTQLCLAEENLPQYNLDLPFPEGRSSHYIKFTCAIQQLGWNNVLNELLMNSFLAYKLNQAYIFSEYAYTWPPCTPLSALIAGPTVGGSWLIGDPAPRAISEQYFELPALTDLNSTEIFAAWQKILIDAPQECIEIQPADRSEDGYPQVFDLWLWGSWRVLLLWDAFSKSPVSQLLHTSPIVERMVNANLDLFTAGHKDVNPFSQMLALHLQRGNFKEACLSLSNWNLMFYSWNLHEFLPDKFTPPAGGGWGYNMLENKVLYMKHCLPSDEDVLKKIQDSRGDYLDTIMSQGLKEEIDDLYLLMNDDSEWLDEVKRIMKADRWKVVAMSRDLKLDQECKDVGMAVDMEIVRKASVFIGNGWLSFTSNILHRWLVDGKIPISNHFY